MLRIGLIGYGYWGVNLARNFSVQQEAKFEMLADGDTKRLDLFKRTYPSVKTTQVAEELINSPEIDAVVIATPVFTHYPLALKALKAGKHVLVEKPMTSVSFQAEELINLAEQKNLVLMVDHTFLYTGAVRKMQELICSGAIGKPQYFDSIRINLGLFQPDVNVLWDLAPHDISILTHLISEKPASVNAVGTSHTQNGIENIAYMTVNYQSNFIAHFNCSWSSPVKVRHTLIGGDEKMIVYNDLEPSEKVRIYDTGYDHNTDEELNRIRVDYRIGDVYIPKLAGKEALQGVAEDFISSIVNKHEPMANGKLGLEVVKILQASQESIKNNGKEVAISE
jgi:predicted dehydrogenase